MFIMLHSVPMHWLAGKTHELALATGPRDQWVGLSTVNLMYNAFVEVESEGELMLDEDFIMGIFSPLYKELPEFNGYLEYYF